MSKLIQLRHRIKAIETIKKITHAMRLIAMSSHSQCKQSQAALTNYTHQLESIFNQLKQYAPHWHHPILNPDPKKAEKNAVIIVGSQKGLCGSFNTHLFKMVHCTLKKLDPAETDIIPIGHKVIEFVEQLKNVQIKHSYKKFSLHRITEIASEITHFIFHQSPPYKNVFIISNHFKSFFVQRPHETHIIPQANAFLEGTPPKDDLMWEQTPQESLNDLAFSYLYAKIQILLFNSLLAEHAARFVSMDGATRNANGILETTKIEYNKLRQAKITKELTELSGNY